MKKLLLSLASATALVSTAANAAPVISYENETNGNFAAVFSNLSPRTATFNDVFTSFTVAVSGFLTGTISTSGSRPVTDLDFTSAVITGSNGFSVAFPIAKTANGANPDGYESGEIEQTLIGPGTYTLRVRGAVPLAARSSASYSGNLNFITLASSVPEPGAWALMILGFGAIGYAMRRQRTTFRVAYS